MFKPSLPSCLYIAVRLCLTKGFLSILVFVGFVGPVKEPCNRLSHLLRLWHLWLNCLLFAHFWVISCTFSVQLHSLRRQTPLNVNCSSLIYIIGYYTQRYLLLVVLALDIYWGSKRRENTKLNAGYKYNYCSNGYSNSYQLCHWHFCSRPVTTLIVMLSCWGLGLVFHGAAVRLL